MTTHPALPKAALPIWGSYLAAPHGALGLISQFITIYSQGTGRRQRRVTGFHKTGIPERSLFKSWGLGQSTDPRTCLLPPKRQGPGQIGIHSQ
jgi:hypothetical protein